MPDTPRPMTTFRNRVLISETSGCAKYLSDLKLEDAPVNNALFRLRHYNQEYSYVGDCQPVPIPGTPTINAVTREFESRVVLAGTTLNDAERFAISNFYNTVASFWGKLNEVYPFVGSALNGAMVPLKATTTTGGAPSPTLTNTFYDRELGVLLGSSSRYLGFGATSEQLRSATASTGFTRVYSFSYDGAANASPILGNVVQANNSSDLFYIRFANAGAYLDSVLTDMFSYSVPASRAYGLNTTNQTNNTYVITRALADPIKVFNEQGLLASSVSTPTPVTSIAAQPFEIGRFRVDGTATITSQLIRLKFFASGRELTDNEAQTLASAIKTFKTAIGR